MSFFGSVLGGLGSVVPFFGPVIQGFASGLQEQDQRNWIQSQNGTTEPKPPKTLPKKLITKHH